MYVGVDYYPEHWPSETWEKTAKAMQKAGFNVVRLAEFAWTFLEPKEGVYDFSLFDRAISILGKHGIKVILGTPTAVMPAWLARKYPETLAVNNGQRVEWGVRKQNCASSGTYRLLSERITRAMAKHYAHNPNVIGWQTDNEFGYAHAEPCQCCVCRQGWHDWLRDRYHGLDQINESWGTHFWGLTYREWTEIPIPIDIQGHNPSACLDWKRYSSWLQVRIQAEQVRILRGICPEHFITHNFMGYHDTLDYFELAKDLDFVSWDNYPVFNGTVTVPFDASGAADLMRGLKRKNFWIMETTSGPCGWGEFGRNVRPGELRKIALHQVAHGADGLVWFRWRTCTVGREQYWHGLVGHDNKLGRRYREAAATAADCRKLSPLLDGTTVKAKVAIIYDYDSLWATKIQKSFRENSWIHGVRRFQSALQRAGVNLDMIRSDADLTSYRLVIAPQLHVLPDAIAKRLNAYVKSGGVLLVDIRTGVKDEHNRCHERTLPGLLSTSLGVHIDEYETIGTDSPYTMQGTTAFPGTFTVDCYADWVMPDEADALASYDAWHLSGYAGLTRNRHGRGWGYYLGANVKEQAFYDALIVELLRSAKVKPLVKIPDHIEVSVREGNGRTLVFLINHSENPQSVVVPTGKTEILTGKTLGAQVKLDRFGIAVLNW
jgi:beta-galactosidase